MKRRVMVIDDHTPSRTFLVQALAKCGFEIVGEGVNGGSALGLVRNTSPDVVLMAVGLPDIDGISTAREIMEQAPHPIVLLTSHSETETIERAKEAGVMAYLIKPLREQELRPAIELAVSRFAEFNSLRKEKDDLRKTLESRKLIERAKGILMKGGLSEAQVFATIQKKSMNLRKSMAEVAQAIVLAEEIKSEKRF
jgi:response regulator NasT